MARAGCGRCASSLVYVGGYTDEMQYSPTASHPGGGKGISALSLDHETGALTPIPGAGAPDGVYDAGLNPTFLATNPAGTVLLATNECGADADDRTGACRNGLTAFRIDKATGALTDRCTRLMPGGAGGCHVSIDPTGAFALVAHYHTGSVGVVPINGSVPINGGGGDGGGDGPEAPLLGEATDLWQTAESGLRADAAAHVRTEAPHAHSTYALPSFGGDVCPVFVLDLGLDAVLERRLHLRTGRFLRASDGDSARAAFSSHMPAVTSRRARSLSHFTGAAGPRHMALHPSGAFAFVVGELSSTLTCCALGSTQETTAGGGLLLPLQTVPSLPTSFARCAPARWAHEPAPTDGVSHAAHVECSPDGRFVLVSNRGHDSLAVYEFDRIAAFEVADAVREAGGCATAAAEQEFSPLPCLHLLGHFKSEGVIPRHFSIDPNGSGLVLVGNHYSDSIVPFRLDEQGQLHRVAEALTVPAPTCVHIVPGLR